MSMTFTTDNIGDLRAQPLAGGGWKITFRSENAGLCHQLYADGLLVAASDRPQQRHFILNRLRRSTRLAVAAVDIEHRWQDLSTLLPAEAFIPPPSIFSVHVVRGIEHGRGDRAALLDDHATGTISSVPLTCAEYWPVGTARWGWGEDAFGQGGFGFDGASAPGMGQGAFGCGQFGLDASTFALTTELTEIGTHRMVVRTITRNGRWRDGEVFTHLIAPPPPSLRLEPAGYDRQSNILTLNIMKG